jgi:hypothetical protein
MAIALHAFLYTACRVTPIEYFLYSAGGCLLAASGIRVTGLA